jgi:hypothetical protein
LAQFRTYELVVFINKPFGVWLVGNYKSMNIPTGSFVDPDPDSDLHGSTLIWLSWIRIRMGNVDPDPGTRKLTKISNPTSFLPFKRLLYLGRYRMLFALLPTLSTFFK